MAATARIVAALALCLLLPGCATLTIATIGIAVGIGAAQGVGKFAGYKIAEKRYARHIAWKRCYPLRNDRYLLERCVRTYAPEYF